MATLGSTITVTDGKAIHVLRRKVIPRHTRSRSVFANYFSKSVVDADLITQGLRCNESRKMSYLSRVMNDSESMPMSMGFVREPAVLTSTSRTAAMSLTTSSGPSVLFEFNPLLSDQKYTVSAPPKITKMQTTAKCTLSCRECSSSAGVLCQNLGVYAGIAFQLFPVPCICVSASNSPVLPAVGSTLVELSGSVTIETYEAWGGGGPCIEEKSLQITLKIYYCCAGGNIR